MLACRALLCRNIILVSRQSFQDDMQSHCYREVSVKKTKQQTRIKITVLKYLHEIKLWWKPKQTNVVPSGECLNECFIEEQNRLAST